MKVFLLLSFNLFAFNCFLSQHQESYKIEYNFQQGEQWTHLKLKKTWHYQKMEILKNTLNDTCKIGVMTIPPVKTGLLYKIEFYADSISYQFKPYKATKGDLIINHVFSDF